ncbi:MAG: hypothetical protein AUK48_03500 [Oscillatoriales cyanobacterium CG2_30_44_21]|nr:MAG: hypothetical protein AUK48_03500 [Oscillatoriales cyanobacterium CG2_30_44_21]
MPKQKTSHQDLYEQDFYLWIEQAVNLLRSENLNELDGENLIEEIESNLEVILMHLLQYRYQPNSVQGALTHVFSWFEAGLSCS